MESIGHNLRGMYRDTLFNSENRLVFDSGWTSNTIVNNCRVLLASFMKGEWDAGISYMKVGKGSDTWSGIPVQPDVNQTDLLDAYLETIPISSASIEYLDVDNASTSTTGPTNRLEIKVSLDKGFPNKTGISNLREFGLFSKRNKDELMINCVNHPLIQKEETDTLIRVIRLIF